MQAIIDPGYIKGNVIVPPSKSMMQRVCAAALLHKGKTIIHNPGTSADDKAALHIISQLGAEVRVSNTCIEITSSGIQPRADEIHCGESGLSARLFIPIVATSANKLTVTGAGSLLSRPMNELETVLATLGVSIQSVESKLPFTIQGALQARDIEIDGSLSSQYVTGLLFALAHVATQAVTISVSALVSKPYIDLSLSVLKTFGYHIDNENYERFHIHPARYQHQEEIEIIIEGDWSSAAFWLVGGAIAGNINLYGLQTNSVQADKAILQALEKAGATVTITPSNINAKRTRQLNSFEFDATDCPDLFPALSVLAAVCKGESMINGIHRLIHKESNRIESIADMLEQFGTFYSVNEDALYIEGSPELYQGTVQSYNDHRIVMAAAVGALRAIDTTIINDAEAVKKSYPDFFSHLYTLGGYYTLTD